MRKMSAFAIGLLISLICLSFIACVDNNGTVPDGLESPAEISSLKFDYFRHLSADVTDATALGLKKETSQKTYLYKTTDDYENGAIEYDETGLTKVTFKKNTATTEDIYDSEGKLIESSTTLTQEDIPAQINKILVSHGKIFIQFIPIVNESGEYKYVEDGQTKTSYVDLRPVDSAMTVDKNGNFDFDTKDYFSDALHQSFVIDSATGYIYKIEGFHINSIKNGLMKVNGDGLIYDMKLENGGNLNIYSLFTVSDIEVSDYFKDKFGNNYIINDSIDQVDTTTNTVFSQQANYYLSSDNQVLYANFFTHLAGSENYSNDFIAYLLGENLKEVAISQTTNINFNLEFVGSYQGTSCISHIKNGIIYVYHNDNISFSSAGMTGLYCIDLQNGYIDNYNFTANSYSTYCIFFIKYDTVLFAKKNGANIDLYYRQIFFDERDDDIPKSNGQYADDLIKTELLLNCKFGENEIRYVKNTLERTIYYVVKFDENNNVVLVEDVVDAEEQKVISLQPINR